MIRFIVYLNRIKIKIWYNLLIKTILLDKMRNFDFKPVLE